MRRTFTHMDTAAELRWFTEEILPCESALKAYLRRRFPDLSDVDDLVQESYLRLLNARKTGSIVSTKSYLFTIARNMALSRLRRPQVFSDQPLDAPQVQNVASDHLDVVQFISQKQEIELLADAIASLPTRCREIFIQVKLQGLSHQEAADLFGLSIDTVHAQVSRGLRKCTEYLKAKGIISERDL